MISLMLADSPHRLASLAEIQRNDNPKEKQVVIMTKNDVSVMMLEVERPTRILFSNRRVSAQEYEFYSDKDKVKKYMNGTALYLPPAVKTHPKIDYGNFTVKDVKEGWVRHSDLPFFVSDLLMTPTLEKTSVWYFEIPPRTLIHLHCGIGDFYSYYCNHLRAKEFAIGKQVKSISELSAVTEFERAVANLEFSPWQD